MLRALRHPAWIALALLGGACAPPGAKSPGAKTTVGEPTALAPAARAARQPDVPKSARLVVDAGDAFLVRPYLQLGRDDQTGERKSLTVVWHTAPDSTGWAVSYSVDGGPDRFAPRPTGVDAGGVGFPRHRIASATLPDLPPGAAVRYRVWKNRSPLFEGQTVAPKAPGQPQRFVVIGDTGEASAGQRRIAYQTAAQRPDFTLITGDIVYPYGRMQDYRDRFFDIQNAASADPKRGAPAMGESLHVGVTGNHDTAYRNMRRYPDGLAYYAYWRQPLNGPPLSVRSPGSPEALDRLARAAEGAYPRGANFTFAYGDAYWVVLDSNAYVSWGEPRLRRWLESVLTVSRNYPWRFVAFHHPPYHSSRKHRNDLMMRAVTDLFTRFEVDIVFSGHVHNYQRTHPMVIREGRITLDREFDGAERTRPRGTLYVVTGAGGAPLYDQRLAATPSQWQPFTARYLTGYSLTSVEIVGRRLTLRQLDGEGRELDRVIIDKPRRLRR